MKVIMEEVYMAKKKKNITVTISPEAETPKKFNLHMCLYTESGLELHFADEIDTSNETKLIVREIIKIPANEMKGFAFNVIDSLIEYEKEFKNGFGFGAPEDSNEDLISD